LTEEPFATVRFRREDAETGEVEEITGDADTGMPAARVGRTDAHFRLAGNTAAFAGMPRNSPQVAADLPTCSTRPKPSNAAAMMSTSSSASSGVRLKRRFGDET
jgi:hypothetical protein